MRWKGKGRQRATPKHADAKRLTVALKDVVVDAAAAHDRDELLLLHGVHADDKGAVGAATQRLSALVCRQPGKVPRRQVDVVAVRHDRDGDGLGQRKLLQVDQRLADIGRGGWGG